MELVSRAHTRAGSLTDYLASRLNLLDGGVIANKEWRLTPAEQATLLQVVATARQTVADPLLGHANAGEALWMEVQSKKTAL